MAEHDKENENQLPERKYIPLGISLGVCFGVALGTFFDHLAIGISIGMCLGLGVGSVLRNKKGNRDK